MVPIHPAVRQVVLDAVDARASTWPGDAVPQQLHLDTTVPDLAAFCVFVAEEAS